MNQNTNIVKGGEISQCAKVKANNIQTDDTAQVEESDSCLIKPVVVTHNMNNLNDSSVVENIGVTKSEVTTQIRILDVFTINAHSSYADNTKHRELDCSTEETTSNNDHTEKKSFKQNADAIQTVKVPANSKTWQPSDGEKGVDALQISDTSQMSQSIQILNVFSINENISSRDLLTNQTNIVKTNSDVTQRQCEIKHFETNVKTECSEVSERECKSTSTDKNSDTLQKCNQTDTNNKIDDSSEKETEDFARVNLTGEPPKLYTAKQRKKWLALQLKMQKKYGSSISDTLSENSIGSVSTMVHNKNIKSECKGSQVNQGNVVSSKSPAVKIHPANAKKVAASAATGVHKFLQLMNLLNSNPDKCKKWLQNQDIQREKLGDKYKEPVIYSTVKHIFLGQGNSCMDKSVPKVNNSLDLLNVLYLNPDKCKVWLKKQEELRIQQGENYQEPVILSTVKLISVHHENSAVAAKDSEKKTNVDRQSGTTVVSKDPCYDNKQNELVKQTNAQTPDIKQTNAQTPDIKQTNALTPVMRKHDAKLTYNKLDTKQAASETSKCDTSLHSESKNSDKINKLNVEQEESIYVLFPPKVNRNVVQKLIHRQRHLQKFIGSKYKVPKFDKNGKKVPFHKCTGMKKFVVEIPLPTKKEKWRTIKFRHDLSEHDALEWINEQVSLIQKYGAQYKQPKLPPPPLLIEETISSDPSSATMAEAGYPQDLNVYQQESYSYSQGVPPGCFGAPDFTTPMEQYYCPVPDYHQSPMPYYGYPQYFAPGSAVGYFPTDESLFIPPPPGTDIHLPPAPSASDSGFTPESNVYKNMDNIPKDTNYAPVIIEMMDIPEPPAKSKPTSVTLTFKAEQIKTPKQNMSIMSKDTKSKKSAVSTNVMKNSTNKPPELGSSNKDDFTKVKAIKSTKEEIPSTMTINKKEDFCVENCTDNIAFYFKGKKVYYPFFVKDFYSRTKWVENQKRIYVKKGSMYTPPEFDRNGKLMACRIESEISSPLAKKISGSNHCDLEDIITQRANDALLSIVDNKNKNEGCDKFGMRINPMLYAQYKEMEESKKVTKEKEEKQKTSMSDFFTVTTKVQPPPEKVKIAVKLKKDDNSVKKEKSNSETNNSTTKEKNCSSIRIAHQQSLNPDPAPPSNETKDEPSVPSVKASTTRVSNSQRTTGWPKTFLPKQPEPLEQRQVSTTPPLPASFFAPKTEPPFAPKTEPPFAPKTEPPACERKRSLSKSKVSAFERLGPPTEAKKPKLTVNLVADDTSNEVTRKVVEEHVPVYLRQDIMTSEDPIVKEYWKMWPWSKPVKVIKECSSDSIDPVMDEIEMEPCYASKSAWVKVVANGYPAHFKKEDVLDCLLEFVQKKEFIPCFTEFKADKCTFLLNRSEQSLLYLHKNGLIVNKDNVQIKLSVSQTNLTLDNLRFYKGAIFKTKLQACYDEEYKSLNLSAFQLQPDNSHFLYFPLSMPYNRFFILNVVRTLLPWKHITMLDLSANRLTNMLSLKLAEYFPSLRILDLSQNLLPTVSTLACFKGVPMYSLSLEGNPLCLNFIHQDDYIDAVKLVFPRLLVLDGVKVDVRTDTKKNFAVSLDAVELVNAFLEIFFSLTESNDRTQLESLYAEKAVFSITCRPEMKRNATYHNLREFYMWCRTLNDCTNPVDPTEGTIVGSAKIVRYFIKWPVIVHDPKTFTVDIMLHTETMTAFKVTGLFKIPAENLTQEEPVTEFSRTFVLATENGTEYKIANDVMYISNATVERVSFAFQSVGFHQLSVDSVALKFETPPDDEIKDRLVDIMRHLTGLKRKSCRRCLDVMQWNIKKALEYYISLEKADEVSKLY